MQEEDARPDHSNVHVGLAILLLATSGLALPLTSFGATAVSTSSMPGLASGAAVIADRPTGQLQGKVVLDGIASVFVVAPPSAVGSRQVVALVVQESAIHANRPASVNATGRPDDAVAHASLHTEKLGFITGSLGEQGQSYGVSAPWLSNAAMSRAGFAGEMMLIPAPTSAVSSLTAAVPKVWWDFFQRRSKFEIYVEILELMKRGPMTPFEVAFYARLNHKRTKEYTEFLAKAGYLQPVNEEGRALYALTKDGLGFLDSVQSLLVGPGVIEVASPGYQRDF